MSGGPTDIATRWGRGDSIQSFTPAERERLRQDLRDCPGYRNPKDREHGRIVADLNALYVADYGDRPEPDPVFVNGKFVDLNAPGGAR